LVESSF